MLSVDGFAEIWLFEISIISRDIFGNIPKNNNREKLLSRDIFGNDPKIFWKLSKKVLEINPKKYWKCSKKVFWKCSKKVLEIVQKGFRKCSKKVLEIVQKITLRPRGVVKNQSEFISFEMKIRSRNRHFYPPLFKWRCFLITH